MSLSSVIMLFLWAIPLMFVMFFASMSVSETFAVTYSNIVQLLAAVIGSIFCFITMNVFDKDDPSRTGWMYIGLGLLSWGIGQTIYFLYELITKQTVPYPYFSDIFYMLLAILVIIGIYHLWKSLRAEIPVWGWIVSLIVLALALFWAISLTNAGLTEGLRFHEYFVGYYYAIFDSLMVFSAVLLATSLIGGVIGNQLWIMIAGLIIYYLGDQFFNLMNNAGTYQTGGLIDISWPLAFGLIAVAAFATKEALTRKF